MGLGGGMALERERIERQRLERERTELELQRVRDQRRRLEEEARRRVSSCSFGAFSHACALTHSPPLHLLSIRRLAPPP